MQYPPHNFKYSAVYISLKPVLSRVPLDMSFVFGIQSYLKNTARRSFSTRDVRRE